MVEIKNKKSNSPENRNSMYPGRKKVEYGITKATFAPDSAMLNPG